MPLWKLILTYDGTPFHGWQIQPALPTVQGTLAAALLHITGESVLPQGSGRTDSGVHAHAQVATVELNTLIPAANLFRALDNYLPASIRVTSAELAPVGFHARHSARRKIYEYRIFTSSHYPGPALDSSIPALCSPMLAPYVWDIRRPLAFEPLQLAAHHILGTHDFTSFAAADPDLTTREAASAEPPEIPLHATNIRTVDLSHWTQHENLLTYRIAGSGFLHHMVRNLVGTFVQCALGRIAPDTIPKILSARDRSAAGPTAPARGLFLVKVEYDQSP